MSLSKSKCCYSNSCLHFLKACCSIGWIKGPPILEWIYFKVSVTSQNANLIHFLVVLIYLWALPGKSYWRERLGTVDLLVLTSLYTLPLILELYFLFYKTTNLNEEVNRTEPFPSVRLPWPSSWIIWWKILMPLWQLNSVTKIVDRKKTQ